MGLLMETDRGIKAPLPKIYHTYYIMKLRFCKLQGTGRGFFTPYIPASPHFFLVKKELKI